MRERLTVWPASLTERIMALGWWPPFVGVADARGPAHDKDEDAGSTGPAAGPIADDRQATGLAGP